MANKNNQTATKQNIDLKKRDDAYWSTLKETRNTKSAIKAYCRGNLWAEENAKAVGNI